jgi:hypothetical protein
MPSKTLLRPRKQPPDECSFSDVHDTDRVSYGVHMTDTGRYGAKGNKTAAPAVFIDVGDAAERGMALPFQPITVAFRSIHNHVPLPAVRNLLQRIIRCMQGNNPILSRRRPHLSAHNIQAHRVIVFVSCQLGSGALLQRVQDHAASSIVCPGLVIKTSKNVADGWRRSS